ncbi:unnamed protein product [Blepharisma stoltei]|uniref:ApaG domain-containing protein n=1 Tax=Blepharisma stoltei TaxID=1481888 RepID=A0AAU9K0V4_9CILI|nr:unnamed protein product [Blepharisma stoltei]
MVIFHIDLLGEILKFLEPKELALTLRTSKSFYTYGTIDSIWKDYCTLLFPYYTNGNYYNFIVTEIWNYLKIVEAFHQVISTVKSQFPSHSVYRSLEERGNRDMAMFYKNIYAKQDFEINPENILKEFKEETGVDMPTDLYQIYVTYDGQKYPGFFGTYRFYDNLTSLSFLPLKKALMNTSVPLFCLGESPYSDQQLLYDLTGELGKGIGALYYSMGSQNTYLHLSSNLAEYLHCYAGKISSGQIEIESKLINAFEWNDCCSDVTTEGIRITARSIFVPYLSSRERYAWAYQIGIEPNRPSQRWRLVTRTWNITDNNGRVDTVYRQPGVIGLFPEVYQGSKKVIYESCCILATPGGTMDGYFTFENMDDESITIDATVGVFRHQLPPGSSFVTYHHGLP